MANTATQAELTAAVQRFTEHHVSDSHEWVLPGLTMHLPAWLSLHTLMLFFCSLLLVLLFGVLYRKGEGAPRGRLTNLLEALVLFIRNQISVQFLGEEDGRRMAPLFCSFFFFILGLNLMGLVPLFAAATANVNVTAALALITLGFMLFGTLVRNGPVGFGRALAPAGMPWLLQLLIAPLELMGLFIRTFALTIRLFVNMLAGHIVIFSMLGLVVIFGWLALPSVALAVAIYLMEIGIAFLQAYIFTLLSAIFIGQMYHPEH
jgi:F-type H+-transporting ATPase subunit a